MYNAYRNPNYPRGGGQRHEDHLLLPHQRRFHPVSIYVYNFGEITYVFIIKYIHMYPSYFDVFNRPLITCNDDAECYTWTKLSTPLSEEVCTDNIHPYIILTPSLG